MKNIIETLNEGQDFDYQKLSQEEQKRRGILGRLVGVIADTKNPTRNGRRYSAELWENVFSNPIMIEKIKNRVCFGEICHPFDGREEVDPEKVAVCLAEVPKKNSKGQLVGVFDILDSPCGRILKTMCDYGTTIGVSSRGTGDLITDYDGNEAVDPSTYDCTGFDIVFIPAVKEARLKYVTESLDKKKYNKTLREKLVDTIDSASEGDKRIMKEALEGSGIVLDEELFNEERTTTEEKAAFIDKVLNVDEVEESLLEGMIETSNERFNKLPANKQAIVKKIQAGDPVANWETDKAEQLYYENRYKKEIEAYRKKRYGFTW